jgi:hypothetical protein
MTGFEPATSGATVRRSATELHPPQERLNAEGPAAEAGRSSGLAQRLIKHISLAFWRRGGQCQRRETAARVSDWVACSNIPGVSTSAPSSTLTAIGCTCAAFCALALYIN